jgi:outer membrane receptor protein involved in Fe transport
VLRLIFLFALSGLATGADATPRSLDIPPGTLRSALTALSVQAGISVSVDDPRLWERSVRRFSGHVDPAEALRRILAQVGAKPIKLGPTSWRAIAAAPPAPRQIVGHEPAPDSDDDGEVIVVTGSKRDVPVRDYAGSVEILGGADLSTAPDRGTEAIVSRLASISSTYLGAGRNKLFIRGIADSSFTGPTQGTVGQYLGDLRLTYNAPDPDLRLYDVRSVEVLEGPQGTLYGAGSLGGIIRIVPNAPEPGVAGGVISAGLSATQHGAPGGDLGGWLNLPIEGSTALRLVGYGIREGGYIDDVVRRRQDINRTDIVGGRATLMIVPAPDWRVKFGAVLQSIDGRDSQYADKGLPPLQRASPTDGGFDARYRMASVVAEREGTDVNLVSSTGWVRHRLAERYDATLPGGPAQTFLQDNHTTMFTSETRLWRPLVNEVGWVVGISYTHNSTRLNRSLGPAGAPLPTTGITNRISEMTGFAEVSARWAGATVTGGLRLTHSSLSGSAEDQTVTGPTPLVFAGNIARRAESNLLPSASILRPLLPGLSGYVRYEEGIRPGGLTIQTRQVERFRSDHARSIETGLRFNEGRPSLISGSASLAYTRWSNIQADYIDQGGLPSTANIGDGRIISLSNSLRIQPRADVRFEFSSTLNDGRVTDPATTFLVLIGQTGLLPGAPTTGYATASHLGRIPNVARFTARTAIHYDTQLREEWTLSAEGSARYVGRSRLGAGPILGGAQGNYVETDTSLRLSMPAMTVSIGVSNLLDAVGNRFALGTPFAIGSNQITPLRPRTVRIGLERAF